MQYSFTLDPTADLVISKLVGYAPTHFAKGFMHSQPHYMLFDILSYNIIDVSSKC